MVRNVIVRPMFFIIIAIIAVVSSGCAPRFAMIYPMDDVSVLSDNSFSKATVAVKPFQDSRKPLTTECPSLGVPKIDKDDKTFFYSCDGHFKPESVARGITQALSDHLNASHLFEKAVLTDTVPSDADYVLTGEVAQFEGLKQYKVSSVVAAQFGLLGALVNLAHNSLYEGTTAYRNIELVRRKDNVVIWKGDITGHISGEESALDTHGWSSYEKATLSLKAANTSLIRELAGAGSVSADVAATAPK